MNCHSLAFSERLRLFFLCLSESCRVLSWFTYSLVEVGSNVVFIARGLVLETAADVLLVLEDVLQKTLQQPQIANKQPKIQVVVGGALTIRGRLTGARYLYCRGHSCCRCCRTADAMCLLLHKMCVHVHVSSALSQHAHVTLPSQRAVQTQTWSHCWRPSRKYGGAS